ncbi:hypothetical protein QFC21_006007 [Naganishia friedmannii]|uniref:Uncharacterized protein n=1 Tax=Naganishia friedmannii TaxID=89922 RepID=A0ACC2V5T5_9TREE|nr:hypothetical protein QFC21_006007 [Naganishia friedmannii]
MSARLARLRQQKLQADRRAAQVLPYTRADIDPVFPTTLWANRSNVGESRQNHLVRVDSSTQDAELPSYNAPAISLPQPAYNPATSTGPTVSNYAIPYSLRPASQTSLSQLPPPPEYVQKQDGQRVEVSRIDRRQSASDVISGLPAYENTTIDRRI